ncbi:hypothetical protein KSC_006810 [Ktedonobacter sp. SOSP1-52]|nr:hypothetical protein KSC_006810 [Ktedonobacter sp. SOSP1-52]
MRRASCLHLLMAAIAAWNTVYLAKAIEASEVQEVRDIQKVLHARSTR